MTRFALTVALGALAACGPSGDPLMIHYTFTDGQEQSCNVETCSDIPMGCQSVALLRIVDPEDPTTVHVNQCVPIPTQGRLDLCLLNQANFDLEARFPTDRVEIQLAIYPLLPEMLDPEDPTDLGKLHCPTEIDFTGTGFAAPTNTPQPALAGVGYADGYDDEVTIELGCNDLGLIDTAVCRNENAVDVTASVIDLDTSISVGNDAATELGVRVGEPHVESLAWVLDSASTRELTLVEPPATDPSWFGENLDVMLVEYACIQVQQSGARTTPSVTCRTLSQTAPTSLDLTGIFVSRETLDDVLDATTLDEFPLAGLVIGIVVDFSGNPVAGATVSNDAGAPVVYLSADRTSTNTVGTSAEGIFVSETAPFETAGGQANLWRASAGSMVQLNEPIGGLIRDRLTVLVIQLDLPTK